MRKEYIPFALGVLLESYQCRVETQLVRGYLFVLQKRVCEMLSKILANLEMLGFAFIRYETEEEAQKAIEGMHGKEDSFRKPKTLNTVLTIKQEQVEEIRDLHLVSSLTHRALDDLGSTQVLRNLSDADGLNDPVDRHCLQLRVSIGPLLQNARISLWILKAGGSHSAANCHHHPPPPFQPAEIVNW
ncbi:hypothetical protein H0E87_026161 [Populus deltoides]|uniref:RRM domain-containing protein n=1 Tax=Populus deltoides TaxID=3696 RepID=A0A8T2X2M2_POPDE|nr:hypothetical protein H0E87_026161 [Populus deltoides]